MGNKSKSKKRSNKSNNKKQQEINNSTKNTASNDYNLFTEDLKLSLKELAFGSISNKQFKRLGLIPEKRKTKQVDIIPLRFPSKLMPAFRKIFGFGKEKSENSVKSNKSYITLISFQSFIHDGQQTKLNPFHIPTLQVSQLPLDKDDNRIGLCLSETNMKLERMPDLLYKTKNDNPDPSIIKVTKKRSFFNDIWKKKPIAVVESTPLVSETKSEEPPAKSISPTSVNSNTCITCQKIAFLAERIQIGSDVFHNSCFKCFHCSKCLYRGKWNKHQDQYYCDYCYKRLMWPFIRR